MEEEFSRGTTEKVSADGHLTYLLITNLLWGSGDEGRSGQQASGKDDRAQPVADSVNGSASSPLVRLEKM